jgi:CRP-like cAMP-binding protein
MNPRLAVPASPGPLPDLAAQRLSSAPPAAARSAAPRAGGRRLPLPPPLAAGGQAEAAVWAGLLPGAPLVPAELAALSALAQWRTVAAGQPVISRGVLALSLVALARGEVALGLRGNGSGSGSGFRAERVLRAPSWLDLGSAWLDAAHATDAQALSAATLLELPRAALAATLAAHPGLAQRLICGLAQQVRASNASTQELMHKDAPARLAHWLQQRLEPVAADATGQAVVRLHERKRDVASQLAITPETLSRLMRSLVRQGVIEVAGYTLRVLDTAALARLADG